MKTQWYQHRLFKPGYGRFPYIVLKVGYAQYMQIPIHFVGEGQPVDIKIHPGTQVRDVPEILLKADRETQIEYLHEQILDVTLMVISKIRVYSKKEPEACLVLAKDKGYYYKQGVFEHSQSIPTGGTLLDQLNNIIAMNVEHYLPDEITKTEAYE